MHRGSDGGGADGPDDWGDETAEILPPGDGGREFPVARIARRIWNPVPVPAPRIDPHLVRLSWPERSAEVVRHALLSAEHWLSGGGILREWLRLNIWVAVILTLAAVLVVPPVTAVLEGAAEWTGLLSKIVGNVTGAILGLPPIILGIATALIAWKIIQRRRGARGARRYRDDYDGYG